MTTALRYLRGDIPQTEVSKHHAIADLTELMEKEAKQSRMQEIIADMGFMLGMFWSKQHADWCGQVMDMVDGSAGLMDQIVRWAGEFDTYWEALPEDDKENYMEIVDDWLTEKVKETFGTPPVLPK